MKYCMSTNENDIIISTGRGFKNLPYENILISESQYRDDIHGKRVVSLPGYDEANNVTVDAILEDV